MEQKFKISVVVPAYNAAQWLKRCVDSIRFQTYKNLEILLINDGSTDETKKIIDEYSIKDSRIIAVHQENQGLVAVREKGICLSTGDYITFVDSDDAIDLDMYEKLLKNALRYKADISHCGMRFCYPDGNEVFHYGTGRVVVQDNFNGIKDLLEGKFIEPSLCNKLYKADLLNDSCLDPQILSNEDLLRNFKIFMRAQKSVYEDFCGYQYIQRENSMSQNKLKQLSTANDIIRARRLILENSPQEIRPYAMQAWLSSVINAANQVVFNHDEKSRNYFKYCRNILKKERNNLNYLIKRQQIAAHLILRTPRLYLLIYSIYKKI